MAVRQKDGGEAGIHLAPGSALRESLRDGYGPGDLRADVMAGLVVGVVALPLSMALAIASGVPPQHGLYTAIVGGAVIAVLGGSRVQVSGPTAAFVVILAPIAAEHGVGGLLVATLMAGIILVLMGVAGLGRLIQFIPYPVVTGFTAGIAVVIATLQVRDFLGLTVAEMPDHFGPRLAALWNALPSVRPADTAIGAATLAMLVLGPQVIRRIPAPLIALPAAAVLGIIAERLNPEWAVSTIADRFSYTVDGVTFPGIPQVPPLPVIPWLLPGGDGEPPGLSIEMVRSLALPAFAIAMLGAIESLLSAVVADGMAGTSHDPNAELVGQGVGNIVAPFFGGIAATGAIARTATNIRSGARSPIASIVHSGVVLAAVLAAAPWLGYLPMSALAALLLLVAWNMSEARHFAHVLRIAPRSDTVVLLTCFALTIVFDMVISVSVGVVLAALLFMRRMVEVSQTTLLSEQHPSLGRAMPPSVLVYEIAGPLFFGAAAKAMSALKSIGNGVRVVVLDLRAVPVMDATGLVNLESAVDRLHRAGIHVVIGGVQRGPAQLLVRAGWRESRRGQVTIRRSFEDALNDAESMARDGHAGPLESE